MKGFFFVLIVAFHLVLARSQTVTDVVFGNLHTSVFDSIVLRENLAKIGEHVRNVVQGVMRNKGKQNPFSIDFHKTEECTLIQLSDENLMTLGESTKEVLSQIYESLYIIEECKSILDKVKARSFEHAEFPVVDYPASSAVTKRLLQALHIYEKKLGKNIFTIDVIVQNTRILAIGIDTDHLHGTKRSDPSKCDTSKAWFLQPHLYIRAPININELRSHFDSMKIYLNKIKLSVEKTMYSVAKVATLSKYYDSKSAIAPKLHWDHDKEPKQYPGAEMDKSLLGLAEKIVEADKELRKEFTKLDSVNSELQGIAFGTNGQIDYVNYWTLAPAKAFLRK